jgi:sugar diacid utilization regulator
MMLPSAAYYLAEGSNLILTQIQPLDVCTVAESAVADLVEMATNQTQFTQTAQMLDVQMLKTRHNQVAIVESLDQRSQDTAVGHQRIDVTGATDQRPIGVAETEPGTLTHWAVGGHQLAAGR